LGEKLDEKKRQVCFRIEESVIKEMEAVREKTGVPVSTQIELRLKGYEIITKKCLLSEKDVLEFLLDEMPKVSEAKLKEFIDYLMSDVGEWLRDNYKSWIKRE
jgi:hypothetical protein